MNATHYRFQFDYRGQVLLAGLYRTGDLGPEATRVTVPADRTSPREAVVPRTFPPAAEAHARQLIEARGGFG